MRLIILLAFVAIVVSMGFALRGLFRRDNQPSRMVRPLTVRIVLSVAVFVLLLLAWYVGLIEPHGLAP